MKLGGVQTAGQVSAKRQAASITLQRAAKSMAVRSVPVNEILDVIPKRMQAVDQAHRSRSSPAAAESVLEAIALLGQGPKQAITAQANVPSQLVLKLTS